MLLFTIFAIFKSYWYLFVLLYVVARVYRQSKVPKEYSHIPSVPTYKVWLAYLKRQPPTERIKSLYEPVANKYGVLVSKLGPRWMVTVSSPAVTKRVLSRPDLFPKVVPKMVGSILERIIGSNVVFSNGNEWRHHRKIASPPFKAQFSLNPLIEVGNNFLNVLYAHPENVPLNVYDIMQRFTIDALGKKIFGYNFNNLNDSENELLRKYNVTKDCLESPLYTIFPWIGSLRFLPFVRKSFNTLDAFDEEISNIVKDRRKLYRASLLDKNHPYNFKEKDFLDNIIQAHGENGITDKELRDNVFILFVAGHDTTAQALTSAAYVLAKYPEIQTKLRQNIEEILPVNAPANAFPSLEELKERMPYLNAFIKEVLRMYPSAAFLPARFSAKDDNLLTPDGPGGKPVYVRKGDWVTINAVLQHNSPHVWDHPDKFLPERFMDPEERLDCPYEFPTPIDSYAWCPFGIGSRMCLGYEFSIIEQKITLCQLLRNFELSLPENSDCKDELKFEYSRFLYSPTLEVNLKRRNVGVSSLATAGADKENLKLRGPGKKQAEIEE